MSDSRGPRLKAQNLHPTKQMLVKLILRLTTYVTMLPASSARRILAADEQAEQIVSRRIRPERRTLRQKGPRHSAYRELSQVSIGVQE